MAHPLGRGVARGADPRTMHFPRDGAQHFAGVLTPAELASLTDFLDRYPAGEPGYRLDDLGPFDFFGPEGSVGVIASRLIGSLARPVRAILFDKTPANNWTLGWHQDRTIAVAEKATVRGFGRWTHKQDIQHVEPPFKILANMLTLRLHLDPIVADNGPLLIAPGSHRVGKILEGEIADVVERCGSFACLAGRGDVWAYATPILHASERSSNPHRRRVLQLDYTSIDLPEPLSWRDLGQTSTDQAGTSDLPSI